MNKLILIILILTGLLNAEIKCKIIKATSKNLKVECKSVSSGAGLVKGYNIIPGIRRSVAKVVNSKNPKNILLTIEKGTFKISESIFLGNLKDYKKRVSAYNAYKEKLKKQKKDRIALLEKQKQDSIQAEITRAEKRKRDSIEAEEKRLREVERLNNEKKKVDYLKSKKLVKYKVPRSGKIYLIEKYIRKTKLKNWHQANLSCNLKGKMLLPYNKLVKAKGLYFNKKKYKEVTSTFYSKFKIYNQIIDWNKKKPVHEFINKLGAEYGYRCANVVTELSDRFAFLPLIEKGKRKRKRSKTSFRRLTVNYPKKTTYTLKVGGIDFTDFQIRKTKKNTHYYMLPKKGFANITVKSEGRKIRTYRVNLRKTNKIKLKPGGLITYAGQLYGKPEKDGKLLVESVLGLWLIGVDKWSLNINIPVSSGFVIENDFKNHFFEFPGLLSLKLMYGNPSFQFGIGFDLLGEFLIRTGPDISSNDGSGDENDDLMRWSVLTGDLLSVINIGTPRIRLVSEMKGGWLEFDDIYHKQLEINEEVESGGVGVLFKSNLELTPFRCFSFGFQYGFDYLHQSTKKGEGDNEEKNYNNASDFKQYLGLIIRYNFRTKKTKK